MLLAALLMIANVDALDALDSVEKLAATDPKKYLTLGSRVRAARDWLKKFPPKDRGPLDPKNVAAGFRIYEAAPKERARLDAGTASVWVVDFPNFLHGGWICWVSAADGNVLAVQQLIEG